MSGEINTLVKQAHLSGYLEAMTQVMRDFDLPYDVMQKINRLSIDAAARGTTPSDAAKQEA